MQCSIPISDSPGLCYNLFVFICQISQYQLQAMCLKHPPTSTHLKSHEEEKEVRSHPQARRVSSDEYRGNKAGGAESRVIAVPELTESFKRMLRLRNHRVPSLVSADVCNICINVCVRTMTLAWSLVDHSHI